MMEFDKTHQLWEAAEQADSRFRNARHQALLLQKELDLLLLEPPADETIVERERHELESRVGEAEDRYQRIKEQLAEAVQAAEDHERAVDRLYQELTDTIAKASLTESGEPDDLARHLVAASNSSVLGALSFFLSDPLDNACTICGHSVTSTNAPLERAQRLLDEDRCPVCSSAVNESPAPDSEPTTLLRESAQHIQLRQAAAELQAAKARVFRFDADLRQSAQALDDVRKASYRFAIQHPAGGFDRISSKRAALNELRERQRELELTRDQRLARFVGAQQRMTETLQSIYEEFASRFAEYSGLFLDEPCTIELDLEGVRGRRRGPQLDPLHASFYPVISGYARYRPTDLSQAQRLFIDLAFRMAMLEVWRNRNPNRPLTATLILETPEGTVDLAYMMRVAAMLRRFSATGSTLVVTTNLNNPQFLPELLSETVHGERRNRILNLLEEGRPRPIQTQHMAVFTSIIEQAINPGERP